TVLQAESSAAATNDIATLTEETTWNLRLVLQNLPTVNGKKVDQIFAIQAQFIEEEGYEPPQGSLRQVKTGSDNDNGESDNDDTITITQSRWILSEDPENRGDSLWIWGLFKDPLYPFLLLQMEVDEVQLPGNEDNKDSIAPFKLFAQINHKRDNGEVILDSGADVTIKQKETIAVPLSSVDIFEDIKVGKLQIQPILSKK
ncbi:MAG: hypothetical protein SGILL_010207, partial [Bacillariaceae sp.]